MVRKLLPHAAIIISMMYFVFFFIDKVNEPMNFIDNGITKGLLFVLCVITTLNAVFLIRDDRAQERRRRRRKRRNRTEQAE